MEYLFEKVLGPFYNLLSFFVIVVDTFFKNFPKGFQSIKKVIFKQIYFSGYEAARLTIQLGVFMGIVIVTQIASFVKGLGGVNLLGKIIAIAVVREVMPLFMAIILIARSGTAITSELGLMKVNGEITTLKALGIDPIYYVVFTRITAFVISTFVITLVACFTAVMTGSFAIFLFEKVAFSDFYEALFLNMNIFDLVLFSLKNIAFGVTIPLVCCFYGLSIKKSVTEVPQMSTKAVLSSFFYVFLLNVLLDFLVLIWQ
ncbi:MAG: ABC transporter permease [bacterium]